MANPNHYFHVNRAFTGITYDEGIRPLFNAVTFSVEGIDEWVGISGIKVGFQPEEHAATISYQQPAEASFNLSNGMQLLIIFDWTFRGSPITKEVELSQKTYFKLVSQTACELNEFTSVIQKITTFLCFVIDETVSLDSMSATSDNLCQDNGEGEIKMSPISIYYPSWPYSKNEPKDSSALYVIWIGPSTKRC